MEFKVIRTSDFGTNDKASIVNLNTLEELMEFQKSVNEEIIIGEFEKGGMPIIEIYDYYRE